MTIKVAIVEDDDQVRENLATLIGGTPGFECIGTYASAEQAIENLPRRRPEVAMACNVANACGSSEPALNHNSSRTVEQSSPPTSRTFVTNAFLAPLASTIMMSPSSAP